ncbi:MAG: ligase-associated DNA damage response endonuclease PdeM [Ottowia sp.]|uniref:ligase-associated DNA damage response endonuclease PdeM n=1 Tax=Ottowia sp. TaxID=1898956 RepID=UPI0039E58F04
MSTGPTRVTYPLDLGAARVELLPEKAVWWPEARTLFVADVHLGKAASFRAHGLPVPEGTTGETLDALSALLGAHAAARLVFLGDFLHGPESHHPAVLAALRDWRICHAGVAMTLVRGNHDRRAGDPPAALAIDLADEPLALGPLAACHHPEAAPRAAPGATALAGHWHPVVHLHARGRDGLRLPCFVHQPGRLVLPAFGAFTGGQRVAAAPGTRCYAVGAGRVWALPEEG